MESDNNHGKIDTPSQNILELGDIIEISSPRNMEYHGTTNFIYYIDDKNIRATNIATLKHIQLNIKNNKLTDESIEQIIILDKSKEKGYARQNDLLPLTWIDIKLGGDMPTILTGQITNLEEDMIEVLTYPELENIYIDFKYQGIPDDIPIEQIVIRNKPISVTTDNLALIKTDIDENEVLEDPIMEDTIDGEVIINIPESHPQEPNIKSVLHSLYNDTNLIFGKEVGKITQLLEVTEEEQRYSIDIQVNDMMDELLSTIPNNKRTKQVLDSIHLLISRYVELREQFSKFDENNNVYSKNVHAHTYKPLVEHLQTMKLNLKWLIPIVTNRKKLNIDKDTIDTVHEKMSSNIHEIEEVKKKYYSKLRGGNTNLITYDHIENMTQDVFVPFVDPLSNSGYITKKQVQDNIDAVVDNLSDFYSTVYNDSNIKRTKYLIQRYNIGTNKLQERTLKSGKTIFERVPLTENDTMHVKSFMMLPKPIIKFSEISLPTSKIINKANLHENYLLLFKLLRKNTKITSHVIDDLTKEYKYGNEYNIFEGINEFILDANVAERMEYMDENERFQRFLEIIIPKTETIFKIYRKYIKHQYSLIGIVQKLEPFMVYSKDVNSKQYNEIKYHIFNEITQLEQHIIDKTSEYNMLNTYNAHIKDKQIKSNTLLTDIPDTAKMYNIYKDINKNIESTSVSELLLKFLNTDNTELYTNTISELLIKLNTPDNILATIEPAELDSNDDVPKIKTYCNKLYLAKKYTSVEQLQKDNNVDEIYFDSEYDDTPYEIIEQYSKEQKAMPTDTFLLFLIENLVSRHGVQEDEANSIASTLILNKKKVLNGHYAILELPILNNDNNDEYSITRYETTYYYRLKDNWIRAGDISEYAFVDTNNLFCNTASKNCVKNEKNNVCEDLNFARIRIKQENKAEIKKEFNKRYQLSVEELTQKLGFQINKLIGRIKRKKIMDEVDLQRANNLSVEIANLVHKDDILQSPYIQLRELIMGQHDFSKKQKDICTFVDRFCRQPLIDSNESPGWLYCKDTNTKLFPLSIYTLAVSFVKNDDYQHTLEHISTMYGVLGDDGESNVDKLTGYRINMLDLNTDEGFDINGKPVNTRDIMNEDMGKMMQEQQSKHKLYDDNEQTKMIYNIASAICNNIDIPFDNVEAVVMRFANIIISKYILSKNSFFRKIKDKKGNPNKLYEKYKNETTIIIICAIILIAIQTAIPSISVDKTFPSCVRSFTGYPLTGGEDITGIEYISCVAIKMSSTIEPWTAMINMNLTKMVTHFKTILDKFLLPISEIEELYIKKKEYLLLVPDITIPNQYKIQKLVHFLPPIIPINIVNSLKNVSVDFKKEMLEYIKKGNPKQTDYINMIKTKIRQHSIAIVETINSVVSEKELLLKTTAMMPFVENACCNDNVKLTNPILYFNEENNNIKSYLQKTVKNIKTINDINKITSARFLFHNESTSNIYPQVNVDYLEENIYSSFIYYCNFDKNLPVPSDIKVICNDVPDGYNKQWNIHEKIDFLKRNNRRFTRSQLHKLMNIINKRNMVYVYTPNCITQIDGLKDIIETLNMTNSSLIDEPMRKLIKDVIKTYKPNQMNDTPNNELINLTNYLTIANQNLYNSIMEFFDLNANIINNEQYNRIGQFLLSIDKWNTEDNGISNIKLQTAFKYIKTMVMNFSKIYPTMIIENNIIFSNVCKHWGFSDIHVTDISLFISNYYKGIQKFNTDDTINNLLIETRNNLTDMMTFLNSIPIITDISKQEDETTILFHSIFDNTTYYEIFKYCIYRVLYEYVILSDDPEIINVEISNIIKDKHQDNATIDDPDTYISANNELMDEYVISSPSREVLKSRVADLLYKLLDIEMENKKLIDISYNDIMTNNKHLRAREKNAMVELLDNMNGDALAAEKLFKKYKLGHWGIGSQKDYTQKNYDRERNNLIQQLTDDIDIGRYDQTTNLRRDIFEIEVDEENNNEEQYNVEMNDISELNEDYMDGIDNDDLEDE